MSCVNLSTAVFIISYYCKTRFAFLFQGDKVTDKPQLVPLRDLHIDDENEIK